MARGGLSPSPAGWPLLGSLYQEGASAAPPRGTVSVRGRAGQARISAGSPGACPLAHPVFFGKYTDAGTQVPQHPKVSAPPPPWPCTPRRLRQGGWRGRLGAVGRAQQSGVRAGNTKLKSPSLAVSTWGLGLPPDAQASYFFPVRWMCWKRVMEKAMPRICMIRTHIPTMPSTCLLSSNHIFTFS